MTSIRDDGHNPRVYLPPSETNIGSANHQTILNNDGNNEKQGEEDEDAANTTNNTNTLQQIEYLYLDFTTPIPTPVGISSSPQPGHPSRSSPPPAPNLTPYTSPFLWSESRKTIITIISCCVTALSAYAAGEYTPPSEELMAKWHVGKVVYNLGITLFTLGFGIAPMVLAPFSEINGRRPIFVASGLVFTGVFFLTDCARFV